MDKLIPRWIEIILILVIVIGSFFSIRYLTQSDIFNEKKELKLALEERQELKSLPVISDEPIRFLFLGDMMLDRHVGEKLEGKKIDYLLGTLSESNFFSGYDLVGANLEGAVTNNGAHYSPVNSYDFAFSPERISELPEYGFNYFTLANNHFTDQGLVGVKETRENLRALNINFSGSIDKEVDEHARTDIELKEKKIALIGLSMVYGNFDIDKAKELVNKASKEVDLVLINIHWGVEYNHQFSKHQQNIGRTLIDAGADAIIGHHPHVIQGMEIYKEKPIFYSLGNFIFDQYFSADTQESLALSLDYLDGQLSYSIKPLKSSKSVPNIMSEVEKKVLMEKFISWSLIPADLAENLTKNQSLN